MIKQFRRNQPNIIFFIIVIGILLWVPLFIYQPSQKAVNYTFTGVIETIYQFLGDSYVLRNILSLLLVLTISLLLSRLNTIYLFINFRTQMPGYWFILMAASMAYVIDLFPILLATLLIVFGLYKLFESFGKKGISFELIDIGFLISLGSLFYPPILFLHLFLMAALLILQGYSWREWLMVILGGIIPFAVMWSISYSFDITFQHSYKELFNLNTNSITWNLGNKIFFTGLGVILLLASLQMIRVFNLKKVNSRRIFSALLAMFVIAILISLLFLRLRFLLIAFIPASYLFTHYFYLIKKERLGNLLFYLIFMFVIVSIVNSIFPTII